MPKCNACYKNDIDFPRQMICNGCVTAMIEEFDTWAPTVDQPTSKDVPMFLGNDAEAQGKNDQTFIDAQKDEQVKEKA